MTVNASRVRSLIDASASVMLRDLEAGADTSTGFEMPVKLPCIKGAYWQDGALAGSQIKVTINVLSLNPTGTYTIEIKVDDSAAHNHTPRVVGSISPVEPGSYEIVIDLTSVKAAWPDADALWIAPHLTVGGASPSISYGAHMTLG